MRKRKKGRKLNREKGQRQALLRSLARELIVNERITTTEARAKEVRPMIEKLVTRARNGDVAARRYLSRYFGNDVVRQLVDDIAPRYADRPGGYTRITKLGPRARDGTPMAVIEFV